MPRSTNLVTIADARSGIVEKIDLGKPGDSPGDLFVFDQPLLDPNHQVIGANSGFCVRTLPGKFSECQWTLTLPNGTITVAGREADKGTSMIPIIGGSGDYQSATGVLATTPNDNRTFTQVPDIGSGYPWMSEESFSYLGCKPALHRLTIIT